MKKKRQGAFPKWRAEINYIQIPGSIGGST
jgi:hypothetical protein